MEGALDTKKLYSRYCTQGIVCPPGFGTKESPGFRTDCLRIPRRFRTEAAGPYLSRPLAAGPDAGECECLGLAQVPFPVFAHVGPALLLGLTSCHTREKPSDKPMIQLKTRKRAVMASNDDTERTEPPSERKGRRDKVIVLLSAKGEETRGGATIVP
jgi:hypothetical protein